MVRSRAILTVLPVPIAALVVVGCLYRGYFMGMLPSAAAELSAITLPSGFRIAVYAGDVPGARQMAVGPAGVVFVAFGPAGQLYVPVGAPCNVCAPPGPLHATITRLDLAGGRPEVVARGVRNSVGFDFDPATGDLWFTDNGRDWLGDDQPPDELNHLTKVGEHFGFPFCHGNGIRDPEHNAGRSCGEFTAPARELGP